MAAAYSSVDVFVCLCDQNDGTERTILALTSQRYEAQAEMDER